MTIIEQLVEERRAKKIKQSEVAYHLGITRSKMSRFERGFDKETNHIIDNYAEYLGYEIRLLKK
jgi:transcriptional regulator with XRE-family HTH domain